MCVLGKPTKEGPCSLGEIWTPVFSRNKNEQHATHIYNNMPISRLASASSTQLLSFFSLFFLFPFQGLFGR